MAVLSFDATGERFYETGAKNAVLYPLTGSGTYGTGVAWNGLTAVTERDRQTAARLRLGQRLPEGFII